MPRSVTDIRGHGSGHDAERARDRRDPAFGFGATIASALLIALIPVTLLLVATELPMLQQALLTTGLSPRQWLACLAVAAALPIVVESSKAIRRRRQTVRPRPDVQLAVSPARALGEVTRVRGESGGAEAPGSASPPSFAAGGCCSQEHVALRLLRRPSTTRSPWLLKSLGAM